MSGTTSVVKSRLGAVAGAWPDLMRRARSSVLIALVSVALASGSSLALAQTAPPLGSAESFAVLGASTVTNTGSSVITGDLGVSPGTAVTGFPPGSVVSGTIHAADAVALAAQNSVITAYNGLVGQPCSNDLTGQNLGGKNLGAGVYCFSSSAQLTGTLNLNANGNPDAVFVFQIGSTLTTASGAIVRVINGGSSCNVFWQVGSSATLGTSTSFAGNILALTSVTLTTGANVSGRTLARNGAVTLDTNNVTRSVCPAAPPPPPPPPTCPPITLNPATLPGGKVAVAYSQTILGSGGKAPYVFTINAGTLPAGLTLTKAGVLAGTPTKSGTSNFTIRGTDANGCFANIPYSVAIAAAPPPPPGCPPITLSPATLPNGRVAVAYTQKIVGSGGAAPYSFGVTKGVLPAGLTLTPAGVLAGTPTKAGTSVFTIRGTDQNGCFAEIKDMQLVIAAAIPPPPGCPPITLSPATLPNGQEGVDYSQTLKGGGGAPPYSFGVTSGALPPGLFLSADGVLSGAPTTSGTSKFTVRVTDANGCFTQLPYTMEIGSTSVPPPVPPPVPVPTLPQTFLILLALGLAAVGLSRLRRRAE